MKGEGGQGIPILPRSVSILSVNDASEAECARRFSVLEIHRTWAKTPHGFVFPGQKTSLGALGSSVRSPVCCRR